MSRRALILTLVVAVVLGVGIYYLMTLTAAHCPDH